MTTVRVGVRRIHENDLADQPTPDNPRPPADSSVMQEWVELDGKRLPIPRLHSVTWGPDGDGTKPGNTFMVCTIRLYVADFESVDYRSEPEEA